MRASGTAEQASAAEADHPARPESLGRPDCEANPKPRDESRRNRGPGIGKTHRQHDADVNHSEHQTLHAANEDSRHGTPVQAAVDAGAAG